MHIRNKTVDGFRAFVPKAHCEARPEPVNKWIHRFTIALQMNKYRKLFSTHRFVKLLYRG